MAAPRRDEVEEELAARRSELARLEERLRAKESSVDLKSSELSELERSLDDRQRNLDLGREQLKEAKRDQIRELERVAGLSAGQAKQILLRELEDELQHESARMIRQVEEEARTDADRRARSILSTVMQRMASGHAVETTVSVVELKSDELKGRIIGREGRNIRALETLTGIDFIIDDTPGAVLLSGFDGVRREIARLTLERLLQDGRIHPARIEEVVPATRSRRSTSTSWRSASRRCSRPNVGSAPPGAHQAARAPALPHELRPERPSTTRSSARGSRRCSRPSWAPTPASPRRAAPPARHRQGRVATRPRARTRWWAASWRAGGRRARPWPTRWRPTTTR